jgi:hypothetical protein
MARTTLRALRTRIDTINSALVNAEAQLRRHYAMGAFFRDPRSIELEAQVKMLEEAAMKAAEEAYMVYRNEDVAMEAARHSAPALQRLSELIRKKDSIRSSRNITFRRNPNRELDLQPDSRSMAQGNMMRKAWMRG